MPRFNLITTDHIDSPPPLTSFVASNLSCRHSPENQRTCAQRWQECSCVIVMTTHWEQLHCPSVGRQMKTQSVNAVGYFCRIVKTNFSRFTHISLDTFQTQYWMEQKWVAEDYIGFGSRYINTSKCKTSLRVVYDIFACTVCTKTDMKMINANSRRTSTSVGRGKMREKCQRLQVCFCSWMVNNRTEVLHYSPYF